jgi:hypothetical protein
MEGIFSLFLGVGRRGTECRDEKVCVGWRNSAASVEKVRHCTALEKPGAR